MKAKIPTLEVMEVMDKSQIRNQKQLIHGLPNELVSKKLSGTYRRENYQLMTAIPLTKENMICCGNIIYCSLPTLLAGHKQDTT